MNEKYRVMTEDERELLARAAAWPGCRSWNDVTRSCLSRVAVEQGVDFATALLYERLRQSDRHGPFIRRVDALLGKRDSLHGKLDALLAVAPGAFYRELPKTGGDGRLLRQHVAAYGCRTAVIPTNSQGSTADNGRVIRDWLADHAHEKILLASLSKGSADIKAALAETEAATVFRPVTAWLNLSGLTDGSPVVSRMRQSKLRSAFGRLLCWYKGIDFAVLEQLEWGPGKVLDFPLALPSHIQLI